MSAVTDGVIAINKPKGMSSAQVIRDCQACLTPSAMFAQSLEQEAQKRAAEGKNNRRRGSRAKLNVKIGHGGTLDPLASGVLILGLNRGTKSLTRFLECNKTYETIIVFGAGSDTQDRVGKVIKRAPYEHITKAQVQEALQSSVGTIKQTPPIFSAIKMNGKPLYEYAREGLPIPRDIPTREVILEDVELLEWYEPGTHRHFWPREQATDEEKNIAQKLEDAIHPDKPSTTTPEVKVEEPAAPGTNTTSKETGTAELVKDEPDPPTMAGEKRKAEEEQATNDNVYEAPSKKPKLQDSLVMSGALQPEPTSTATNTSIPTEKPLPDTISNPPTPPESKPTPPTNPIRKGKGSDLLPQESPTAPAPWEDIGPPAAKIRLRVSSGFYVRTYCHDLGMKVGSVALMAELVRTTQSMFALGKDVMSYEALQDGESEWAPQLTALLEKWALFEKEEKKMMMSSDGTGIGTEDRAGIEKRFWAAATVAAVVEADEPEGGQLPVVAGGNEEKKNEEEEEEEEVVVVVEKDETIT